MSHSRSYGGAGIVVLCLLVAVVGLSIYILSPKTEPTKEPAPEQPYTWFNPLNYSTVPNNVRLDGFEQDKVRRFINRLDWGNTDVQNWTLRHLQEMGDSVGDVAANMLGDCLTRRPLYAKKILDLLALVAREEHLKDIRPALYHDMDFVRTAGVKAVARVDSDETFELLGELTRSSDNAVKTPAFDFIRQSGTLGDPEYLVEFISAETDRYFETGEADSGLIAAMRSAGLRGIEGVAPAATRLLDAESDAYKNEAARTLVAIGDPEGLGMAHIESQLRSDLEQQQMALSTLSEVRGLPSLSVLEVLADSDDADTRLLVAQVISSAIPPPGNPKRQGALTVLEKGLNDPVSQVRTQAIQGLYFSGEHHVAMRFLDKVSNKTGGELRDAVQMLAERLKDPRGIEAMRERMKDPNLTPLDRSHLIHGIAAYRDVDSIPSFIEDIRRAGSEQDPMVDRTKLSFQAAVKIQSMGQDAVAHLLTLLEGRVHRQVDLFCLDSLRGIISELDRETSKQVVETLSAVVLDEARAVDVRVGAAESFTFLDDLSLVTHLDSLREDVRDSRVAKALDSVIWNYF